MLASMTCPFCGQKEIYVYPATQERPWWVVGCQSVQCDSSWHIDKNCGQTVLAMFEKCQPPKFATSQVLPSSKAKATRRTTAGGSSKSKHPNADIRRVSPDSAQPKP
jgi:hypothetical protein